MQTWAGAPMERPCAALASHPPPRGLPGSHEQRLMRDCTRRSHHQLRIAGRRLARSALLAVAITRTGACGHSPSKLHFRQDRSEYSDNNDERAAKEKTHRDLANANQHLHRKRITSSARIRSASQAESIRTHLPMASQLIAATQREIAGESRSISMDSFPLVLALGAANKMERSILIVHQERRPTTS